jgi:hypothetical protein
MDDKNISEMLRATNHLRRFLIPQPLKRTNRSYSYPVQPDSPNLAAVPQ